MTGQSRFFNVLTLFGLGYLRFSASTASAVAAALYVLLYVKGGQSWGPAILFVIASIWAGFAAAANREFTKTDPMEAVIDEFLGMLGCLLIAGSANVYAVAGMFVAFRALDIWKPPPFDWLDRNVHGAYGFIIDDLAIGIVIGCCARLALVLLR